MDCWNPCAMITHPSDIRVTDQRPGCRTSTTTLRAVQCIWTLEGTAGPRPLGDGDWLAYGRWRQAAASRPSRRRGSVGRSSPTALVEMVPRIKPVCVRLAVCIHCTASTQRFSYPAASQPASPPSCADNRTKRIDRSGSFRRKIDVPRAALPTSCLGRRHSDDVS